MPSHMETRDFTRTELICGIGSNCLQDITPPRTCWGGHGHGCGGEGGGVGNLGQAVWDIAKYEMWWKKISEIYEAPASC